MLIGNRPAKALAMWPKLCVCRGICEAQRQVGCHLHLDDAHAPQRQHVQKQTHFLPDKPNPLHSHLNNWHLYPSRRRRNLTDISNVSVSLTTKPTSSPRHQSPVYSFYFIALS